MSKVTETVLEINLGALEHNYRFLKSKLRDDTGFLAVVKAFAYGSDAIRIAQKLSNLGVDYFAVAYTEEGRELREANITKPILVLHPLPGAFQTLMEHDLEPSIYSKKMLVAFAEAAKKYGRPRYPIHLKFNTGLNRLGFAPGDVPWITNTIKKSPFLYVQSTFSHLAASEDRNEREFSLSQIAMFQKCGDDLDTALGYRPFRHMLNTSGIINYPEAQFDMVRSGIGLYGFGNSDEIDARLRPISSLKTVISQLHQIGPNESVGYNRGFLAKKPTIIATLPLGHADGIGRQYGHGKTFVTLHGHKAYIVGNVCMDMLMVDVTGIDCQEGDPVVVFGEHPTAERFAASAGTISYELLTGISQRVPRVFLEG